MVPLSFVLASPGVILGWDEKAPGSIPGQLINFNGGPVAAGTPIRIIFKCKSTSSWSLFII